MTDDISNQEKMERMKNNFRIVRKQNSCRNCISLRSHGDNGYNGWSCSVTEMFFYPIKIGLTKTFVCDEYKRSKNSKSSWILKDIEIELKGNDTLISTRNTIV